MKGFQLTFFMEQNQHHEGKPLCEWLIEIARSQGIRGATAFTGSLGFGQSKHIHSAHFFELADQPIEVTLIVTEEEVEKLFAFLRQEKLELFYVKSPVEFGSIGN